MRSNWGNTGSGSLKFHQGIFNSGDGDDVKEVKWGNPMELKPVELTFCELNCFGEIVDQAVLSDMRRYK